MILGQLRMEARQAKNAPLSVGSISLLFLVVFLEVFFHCTMITIFCNLIFSVFVQLFRLCKIFGNTFPFVVKGCGLEKFEKEIRIYQNNLTEKVISQLLPT